MGRDLPKGEAPKPARWASQNLKKARKPVRKLIQKVAADKKTDSRKNHTPSTSDPFAFNANPYLIEAAQDVITKNSTRFRTLFPEKWNALLATMQPIDVLLLAMQIELHDGNYREAARHAATAAPYRHPRLSHVHATVEKTALDNLTDVALAEVLADIGERLAHRRTIDGTATESPGSSASSPEQAPERATPFFPVS